MFTLRTVRKSDNAEDNFYLGESYRFISRKWAPDLFAKELEKRCDIKAKGKEFDNRLIGMVISNFGDRMHPIMKDDWSYIMTENGQTFANLSHKPSDPA